MTRAAAKRPYVVRSSSIHGKGVFATRVIRKGTSLIEYRGTRVPPESADNLEGGNPEDPSHTFLFETSDGTVIDASRRGNAARWINHACDPNCEALEDDDGRVWIHARRSIRAGEELTYDYRLRVDGRITKRLRELYACRCQSPRCRKTLLRIPKRRRPQR
jgi:uncharacterized protein